jgi:hypothetical protein
VAVEVQGYPHFAMPQAFAGRLRDDAAGEQMGCVGVPQIVEAEMRKLRGADRTCQCRETLIGKRSSRARGWRRNDGLKSFASSCCRSAGSCFKNAAAINAPQEKLTWRWER